jgi:drug/metabolite transporter (DMT)-like permease
MAGVSASEPPNRGRGLLLVIAGVVLVSPDALLLRLISADPMTLVFWRGLLVAVSVGTWILLRRGRAAWRQARSIGPGGVLVATLFAANLVLFVFAILWTSVANALVILNAAPLGAAILSAVFLRERVPLRTWLAVIAVLAGIVVIFRGSLGGGTLAGDLCALAAALCLGGKFVALRSVGRDVDVLPMIALSGLMVAACMFPLAAPLSITALDASILAVLGLLILPGALALMALSTRHLPAAEVSLVILLETLLAPALVWLVLAEVPRPETWLGGLIVLATLVLHGLATLREELHRRRHLAAGRRQHGRAG